MAFEFAAPPETLDDDPPLRELMTRHLVGVSTDAGLQIVVRLLGSTRVRHLPVMEGDRCVGLLFEHDAVRALGEGDPHAPEPLAAQLCRAAPVLTSEDRRSAAVLRMAQTGIDAVLVLRDGKVLGIVTAIDVVQSHAKARFA